MAEGIEIAHPAHGDAFDRHIRRAGFEGIDGARRIDPVGAEAAQVVVDIAGGEFFRIILLGSKVLSLRYRDEATSKLLPTNCLRSMMPPLCISLFDEIGNDNGCWQILYRDSIDRTRLASSLE